MRQLPEATDAPGRIGCFLCVLILLLCVGLFVLRTWHWSLISDAVLMHYVVFLMQHGLAPYRDIIDINMPGAYLLDRGVIGAFGSTALGWRVFDLLLLVAAGVAMLVIARPYGWFGGILAATLFALIHGADGVAQAGQRDFCIAVILLLGCACLLVGFRQQESTARWLGAFAWGLAAGLAATIKPHYLFAGVVVLFLAAVACRRRGYAAVAPLAAGVLGLSVPLAVAAGFLAREHVLRAFAGRIVPLMLYHVSMGRHSILFLLGHLLPTKVLPLVIVALIGSVGRFVWSRWEASVLAACAATGLLSYVAQGKAYSYHRQTLLGFILCLATVQLVASLQAAQRSVRVASFLALGYAVLWLAPSSTAKAIRWNCAEPTLEQMAKDLASLKPSVQNRGGIQCMDTMSGCITVLSRMQIVQSTGFLYDCYFLAPQASATREAERRRFLQAVEKAPPAVYVITDQWCFNLPSGYRKLEEWPAFEGLLAARYQLVVQRDAPDAVPRNLAAAPFGYRVYRRRDTAE